jgi:hypothetical protein
MRLCEAFSHKMGVCVVQKLTTKQVALLLSISSMAPQSLHAINMSDVISQGMAPHASLNSVKLVSAQAGLSVTSGNPNVVNSG